MEIPKRYDPKAIEDKWYAQWLKQKFFRSTPDHRKPYTIVIPPPNITGVLHMGHMLNNTIQDVLIRKARLQGYNACWVPGTDHASIATEAKVVAMLREKGIKKSDLSREEFMNHAWEWKRKYGGIILEQLKKLGASVDWERVHFTMDDGYCKAVIRVFVDLYRKGHIYRGLRMINWDCEAQTALSNEEVVYAEEGEKSFLYHVKYRLRDTEDYLIIATQRPETIMGDTAVAVNPHDERYSHLIGKTVLVPMINRPVPVIADNYVEKEFGTGCLKVTPAHDQNDYEIGLRHNLPVIDTLNPDGTLNEKCEIAEYIGKDRFEVRQLVVERLRAENLLVKEEEFITRIGRSERTNSVVEPRLSMQWFIRMKEISQRALQAVEMDEVRLHPEKFKNTYRHWMENVRDWCISRQLWWGHRIPAWYDEQGNVYVAETYDEALQLFKEKVHGSQSAVLSIKKLSTEHAALNTLKQDEDVLDTWASSWLWPIAVFDGFNDKSFDKRKGKVIKAANAELNYYYPTTILVTAPEILFFWVARMIIAGYEYLDEKPFSHVYLHGIVRDKQRRKMSKSLGNSPEPLELIEKYGADGVRIGMLFSSPAGNDLLFDEKLCEQGRNFCNKIWNAMRLVKSWKIQEGKNDANQAAILWFESRLSQVIRQLENSYADYRISEALLILYNLIWDDFCSWYLEMIKPQRQETRSLDLGTYEKTIEFFGKLLQLAHPFLPFITEEIWHLLKERSEKDCITVSRYPEGKTPDEGLLKKAEAVKEIITRIRDIRGQANINPNEPLPLYVLSNDRNGYELFRQTIMKLASLKSIEFVTAEIKGAKTFLVGADTFFLQTPVSVNVEEERKRLAKEIDYIKGFIRSVNAKLNNERFVKSAPPAVVEKEKQKLLDSEAKLKALEESLTRLN
ncbi:MAG TPA: valine--tRNA ligase [Chitinophagales bacterium]|nr:valine--tRNA ligase [Chitinophagales bacterium]